MNSLQRQFTDALVFTLLAALAACSGGGGADGGGAAPPPPNPVMHAVGGTVSGLAGAGLVLRNNGGDDLGISTNGVFTFATALANGASYSVTVATQPPGETCTVTNGAGTLAGANVTNVAVMCVTPPPPDTIRPSVTTTTPVNGAIAVAVNTIVTAAFSEPMNCATLTGTSFSVTRAGGSVAGSVSCSNATATFTPVAALAFSTTYTATVTTGARDIAGNALAQSHTWTFTTVPPPDTTAPTVIRTDPLPTANGTSLTDPVVAVFSEALNPSSVTVGTFIVADATGAPINGAVTLSADGRTASFTPQVPLAFATQIEARLTTAVRDLAGNQLASDFVWRFNTGKQIAAGDRHTCARLVSGVLKCWGENFAGQLGLGDTNHRGDGSGEMGSSLPAVNLGSGRTAVEIVASTYHSCARLDNGTVKCWGGNASGQLGLGNTVSRGDGPGEMGDSLPAVSLGAGRVALELAASRGSSVSGGDGHTCARLDNGTVKCWGSNGVGQLGLGDTNPRGDGLGEMGDNLSSMNLGAGRTAVEIAAGSSHTCARLDNGAVKCWGWNAVGQLGLGDTANRGDGANEMGAALPAVDLGSGVVAEVAASGLTTCARFNDGRVKCWGSNSSGQLGLGDTASRGDGPAEMGNNLPAVSLGTGHRAAELAVGNIHTCARLDDGTAKCWGFNGEGQLGIGDRLSRGDGPNEMGDNLRAIDLGTGRRAGEITAGSFHICARLDNEMAKCWGRNFMGQLGLGDVNSRGDVAGEMGDSLPAVDLGN